MADSEAKEKLDATLGDGDDGEGDLDLELVGEGDPPMCYWSDNEDEHRRVFVFDRMATADIAGNILVENMNAVANWIKDGAPPGKARTLKTVKD